METKGRNFYSRRLDKSAPRRIMAHPVGNDGKSKSTRDEAKLIGPYRRGDCRSAFLSGAGADIYCLQKCFRASPSSV